MKRESLLARVCDHSVVWDVLVIGGGATGLGAAVDAATRGYSTLLLERGDFAQGTSLRCTQSVAGGVALCNPTRHINSKRLSLRYGTDTPACPGPPAWATRARAPRRHGRF